MIQYLKNRLEERSTWIGLGGVVTGAAALSSPYSWIVIGLGAVAMLCPTKGDEK